MSDPLVTAVMVTSNRGLRQDLARLSLASFLDQTYVNKELIIVLDHDSVDFVINDPRVKVLRGPVGCYLGKLRDCALDHAQGEFIIQWDDDDWHREDAIAYQLAELLTPHVDGEGWDACCLSNQIRYDFESNSAYIKHCPVGHAGTILHRRACCFVSSKYHRAVRYENQPRSEDAGFWKAFWEPPFRHKIVTGDAALYLRFFHGHNTWGRGHIMGNGIKPNDYRGLTNSQITYLNSIVRHYPCYNAG